MQLCLKARRAAPRSEIVDVWEGLKRALVRYGQLSGQMSITLYSRIQWKAQGVVHGAISCNGCLGR
jgi:hypothetical protein